jgi:hypothetical protein
MSRSLTGPFGGWIDTRRHSLKRVKWRFASTPPKDKFLMLTGLPSPLYGGLKRQEGLNVAGWL